MAVFDSLLPALNFPDHFSGHARQYAQFRPGYPPELFNSINALTPEHELAWDCGTGSGQAAERLAGYYKRVIATDPSAQQVGNALHAPRVLYLVAQAERSCLGTASVDLVTVAQALHWFDHEAFYAEVRRVAKHGAVLVAWGYGLAQIDPPIDDIIAWFYSHVVGPYWPPERRYIEQNYQTLPFPFSEIAMPGFMMHANWNLNALCDYLGTWSATRRYQQQRGDDPIPALREELAQYWGERMRVRSVDWSLFVRAGRIA
jgi:SAM-dependent methyltransferase